MGWGWIWKLKLPNKIIFFIWLLKHGKILSNQSCVTRGITQDAHCKICGLVEDADHIFRKCRRATTVWYRVGTPQMQNSGDTFLNAWLDSNLKNTGNWNGGSIPFCTIFACTIWNIWLMRNDLQFNQNEQNINQVARKSINLADEINNAFLGNLLNSQDRVCRFIKWNCPYAGGIKVNSDGSCLNHSSAASYGLLARNDQGKWIEGFCGLIGAATCLEAELWGIRQALKLTEERGWNMVEIESDSQNAVDLINSGEDAINHPARNLVEVCRMLKEETNATIKHILREANICADKLANLGRMQREQVVRVLIPPDDVIEELVADMRGVEYPRGYKQFLFTVFLFFLL